MEGFRNSKEEKIRILREAETADKSIINVLQDKDISDQSFHRWQPADILFRLLPFKSMPPPIPG